MPEVYAKLPLSQVAGIERGKFSARPRNDPQYYGGQIPFLQTGDIARAGRVIQSWTQTLNELGLGVSKMFPRGTIFMSIAANIGDVAISDFDAACPDSVVAVKPRDGVDREWLFQSLKFSKNGLAALATQNAQANLSLEKIEPFRVQVPPLPKQRKIAEILRTWDEALEKLTALRAAKKKVRDATLQTILNNPDWPERSVSELGTVASAGVDKKSVEGERPVRLLNFVDVLRRDFLYDAEFTHEVTAPKRKTSKCDVRKGDVFFTPSSETRDDIAHSAVAMETMPGVVYSYHVVRLRPMATLDLRFRPYLFKSRHFLRQAYALAAGSGQRYVLSQDQFRQMTVRLPDHKTQAKVSAYFATTDREIALLDAKIEALTRQKRGLMQKLLTGEWRVKLEATVA